MSPFSYDLHTISTFRDRAACERARTISRAELTSHPNPDFRIRVVDDPAEFYRQFADDLVGRIRAGRDAGRPWCSSSRWGRCRSSSWPRS